MIRECGEQPLSSLRFLSSQFFVRLFGFLNLNELLCVGVPILPPFLCVQQSFVRRWRSPIEEFRPDACKKSTRRLLLDCLSTFLSYDQSCDSSVGIMVPTEPRAKQCSKPDLWMTEPKRVARGGWGLGFQESKRLFSTSQCKVQDGGGKSIRGGCPVGGVLTGRILLGEAAPN